MKPTKKKGEQEPRGNDYDLKGEPVGEGLNQRGKTKRVRDVIWKEPNGDDGERKNENLLENVKQIRKEPGRKLGQTKEGWWKDEEENDGKNSRDSNK